MPKAGRKCGVCTSDKLADVNDALLKDGDSNQATAIRFGFTKATIQRHRVNCLRAGSSTRTPSHPARQPSRQQRPSSTAPARAGRCESPQIDEGASVEPAVLIRRVDAIVSAAEGILKRAVDLDKPYLALKAVSECRESLRLLMQAVGMLAPDGSTVINVDARRLDLSGLEPSEVVALADALTSGTPLPASIRQKYGLEPAPQIIDAVIVDAVALPG